MKHNSRKIKCGIDYIKDKKIGGPTINSNRISNSSIAQKIEFIPIFHDMKLGRGISWNRVIDLKNQIKKNDLDVLLISGVQLAAFHILIAAILSGQKSRLMILRGFSFDALDISFLKRTLMAIIIEPLCFLMCTRFVGNSLFSSNRFISRIFFWKNEGSIYNLIPEISNQIESDNIDLRRELNISDDKIILSSVGRITADKGYKLLAESILALSRKRNDFVVVVAGNGNYMSKLNDFIDMNDLRDCFILLGERNDIVQINKMADIFIMPSLHETLSSALLEAAINKCALISTNTGGMVEIVKHGFNGYVFKKNSCNELTKCIEDLLNDQKLRECMGRNAKSFVEINFDNSISTNKLERFICP